jgi:hypothetical protein
MKHMSKYLKAAELIAKKKESYICSALSAVQKDPSLLNELFRPHKAEHTWYSYTENNRHEIEFHCATEKGRLGRTLVLLLLDEIEKDNKC